MRKLSVLITGTSKGIGFDLVRIFLKKHPEATIYATSRNDSQKEEERWRSIDANNAVKCKKLNIRYADSINQFIS